MKAILVTFLALCFAGATQLKAQSFLDKLDRTLNKVDRAANTADRAAGTGGKMMGLLGKKKAGGAERQTVISINGIDMASCKTLNQDIQKAKNVSSTKMKYNAAGSSIIVAHNGTTDDLLQAIQQVSTVLADKNISGLEEGVISVEIKK